jgi:hypothetical protein
LVGVCRGNCVMEYVAFTFAAVTLVVGFLTMAHAFGE